jgi:hypothetical protein
MRAQFWLDDLGVDIWILLKFSQRRCELDSFNSLDDGNEPSGTIRGEEFLTHLIDCQVLKNCAAWSQFLLL